MQSSEQPKQSEGYWQAHTKPQHSELAPRSLPCHGGEAAKGDRLPGACLVRAFREMAFLFRASNLRTRGAQGTQSLRLWSCLCDVVLVDDLSVRPSGWFA